jgi:hypothetical protein
MGWLFTFLLVSVCALMIVCAGVAWHIWRQHAESRTSAPDGDHTDMLIHKESDIEPEKAQ